MNDKRAIIVVSGGVADCAYLPDGMEIEIRDYDVEGSEHPDITLDNDGDEYIPIVFTH